MPTTLKTAEVSENDLGFGSYFKDLESMTSLVELYNDGHANPFQPPVEYPHDGLEQCLAVSAGGFGAEMQCHQNARTERFTEAVFTEERTDIKGLQRRYSQPSKKLVFTLPPKLETYVSRYGKLYYTLRDIQFNPNNSLTSLDLGNNLLTQWIGPIKGLNKLIKLNLANNLAQNVTITFFDTFSSLKELNVSWNFLRRMIRK